MATVTIQLPSMLADLADGTRQWEMEAATLDDARRQLLATFPKLEVHLFDDGGNLREHVLMLLDDENVRWFDTWDVPLRDGQTITIMQAVTGG
jgi:molybdopterin converting factor small subunit